MKDSYRSAMDSLRFTQEQKAQMVERLMAVPARRPARLRRTLVLAAAAVLITALGIAASAGALDGAVRAFAGLFSGSRKTEVIGQMGSPVDAADTADGITVTAEAILGDEYNYAVCYTISRADGTPLPDGAVADGAVQLMFGTWKTSRGTPSAWSLGSTDSGFCRFFDRDPADGTVQLLDYRTADRPLNGGSLTVAGQDLFQLAEDGTRTLLAAGPWQLEFALDYADTSQSLPAGQRVQVGGMDAVLDAVTMSPLSMTVAYTVSGAPDPRQSDGYGAFRSLPISVTYTDGTTITPGDSHSSGRYIDGSGVVEMRKTVRFSILRPLSEVASVSIGDATIAVTP